MKRKTQQAVPSDLLERLRELIESKDMQAGDRLPSERALALKFGVGRPSLREAIKALETLDVLDSRHGEGTFIKSRAGLSGGWTSKVELNTRNVDLMELLEVRKMFEPRAAALAAARATEKHLAMMERELVALEKRPNDLENVIRHDYLFHEIVFQATGNAVLLGVAKYLAPSLMRSRKTTGMASPDLSRSVQQHRAIFEVIRRRDPELAEHAMRSHLQTTGLDLIAYAKSDTRG